MYRYYTDTIQYIYIYIYISWWLCVASSELWACIYRYYTNTIHIHIHIVMTMCSQFGVMGMYIPIPYIWIFCWLCVASSVCGASWWGTKAILRLCAYTVHYEFNNFKWFLTGMYSLLWWERQLFYNNNVIIW